MAKQRISYVVRENYDEAGHNSGINSLALDVQTPGGLLYTAGKDSKIVSWDLHLDDVNSNPYYVKRENMSNMENLNNPQEYSSFVDINHEEINNKMEYNESFDSQRDFSLVKNYHSEEITKNNSYNHSCSLNNSTTGITIKSNIQKLKQKYSQNFDLRRRKCITQTPTFNTNYWYHSDWVNDIVLTEKKDHFISASSDRSIYLWDVKNKLPLSRIGFHKDDVRVLAYSSKRNWVASGGFDQRVLFWDLGEGRVKPIFTSDDSLTQASIYSIATNNEGNVLVTGSPERIVRIWDTRQGKQVLKLTGHSDNVRALIVSEDGKWVLSGSSDSSIKLWSIANVKRCVMTYNHYSDSVWSLTSNDPYLKTFWAGGRDGCITKINQSSNYDYNNQYDNDYGDCVLVCKENAGIVKLAAINNGYIYAATNSSNINCWRDIPLSSQSLNLYKDQNANDFERINIPKSSVITQPNDIINDSLYTFNQIQSVASVDTRSISLNDNYIDYDFSNRLACEDYVVPIFSKPEATIQGKPPIIKFTMMNDRRHVLTQDSDKNIDEWDIILCKKNKSYGKADYDKVLKETNKKISTENWCSVDIHTGALTVSMIPNKVFESLIYYDECIEDELVPDSLLESRVNIGRWVLTNLFYNFIMAVNNKDPNIDEKNKELLNVVNNNNNNNNNNNSSNNNNETENENLNLAKSNSSIRCLTPLLTDDNCSVPESIGTLSMTSLNKNECVKLTSLSRINSQKVIVNKNKTPMFPELKNNYSDEEDDAETNDNSSYNALSPCNQSSNDGHSINGEVPEGGLTQTPDLNKDDSSNYLIPSDTAGINREASSNNSSVYLSSLSTLSKNNSVSTSNNLLLTPLTPLSSNKEKSGSSLNKSNSYNENTNNEEKRKSVSNESSSQLKTKEKSFIRRIRSHVHKRSPSSSRQKDSKKSISSGGISSKSSIVTNTTLVTTSINSNNPSKTKAVPEPKTDGPINFAECPYVKLPREVPIIISSLESDDAVTYIDQDRETVGSLGEPNTTKYLCNSSILPKWVYDCVINKKIPAIEAKKVNFVLKPYPKSDMPEFPTGNNHLCANRMLRIRKVITYVVDKLNLSKTTLSKANRASSVSLSEINTSNTGGIKAENWIEILCNEEVLDPSTTLATCKNHYSKTSGDVVLYYRYIIKEIK
ncbi:WD40 repeat-like protein [Piromyces finnis]|uniref:WD40 repeat-like protein n=1 Tax=Piromyces finnis TaxID=1754191 RepID=A0A1Y1V3S6_9FUNG|nr:WD40 repeat-like protein [Piromyces finnis]|eukprot:ORX45759.1 WD40 repeat-like protein [Piromyces finnis]